jgi:hypothetical protein
MRQRKEGACAKRDEKEIEIAGCEGKCGWDL